MPAISGTICTELAALSDDADGFAVELELMVPPG